MKKGTYLFKDKDPIIDVLRTALQLYASINGLTFAKARGIIAIRAGMTDSSLYAWFEGATCWPFYKSVARVVEALGRPVQIGARKLDTVRPKKLRQNKPPRLTVVKSRAA